MRAESGHPTGLTVIAPAHNERENIEPLVRRVGEACARIGRPFEFLVVDDASTDGTGDAVCGLMAEHGWLRLVRLGKPVHRMTNGQSAAFAAGIAASRGALIATLDADLQNDPADLPGLIERMEATGADLVQGDRSHARRAGDARVRRFGSAVGRHARRAILNDPTRDTGCSLRVMRREVAADLPLAYRGIHRFIPVSARSMGYTVVEMPVSHASRHAGTSKYGMGIAGRAIPGLIDCFAVRWMSNRVCKPSQTVDATGPAPLLATPERPEAVTH